jgi:mycothiol synthase
MAPPTLIEPAGPHLDQWCAMLAGALAAESGGGPDGPALAARIRAEDPAAGVRRWAAVSDGTLAGVAQSSPDGEDRFVRLYVPESHRRRGIGSALLRTARESGASLKSVTVEGSAGERFAMNRGATVLMRLVVLEHRLDGISSAGDAICWTDGAPQELLDSYAAAYNSLADAPDSHHQSVRADYDAGRIRRWERSIRAGGNQLWVCAIVRDGVVVAFTEVEAGPGPVASQHSTVVVPSHRRRGLGVAVKRALAARLHAARPDITTVTTTVNAANTPMLALNERVGYRRIRTRLLLRLPAVQIKENAPHLHAPQRSQ